MAVLKWLLIRQGNLEDFDGKTEYELDARLEKTVNVGRGRNNSIVLGSLFVSRQHCSFVIVHGDLYITDLGAENGTYINNVQVVPGARTRLNEGDTIGLGVQSYQDKDSFLFEIKKEDDCDDHQEDDQTTPPTSTTTCAPSEEVDDLCEMVVDIEDILVQDQSAPAGSSKRHLEGDELERSKSAKVHRQEHHEVTSLPSVTHMEISANIAQSIFTSPVKNSDNGIEIIELSSDEDEFPSSSVRNTELFVPETDNVSVPTDPILPRMTVLPPEILPLEQSAAVLEPVPSTSSITKFVYNSVVKSEPNDVITATTRDMEDMNDSFMNDFTEDHKDNINQPDMYVNDDDVIFVDDGESYWQPSQLFIDTQPDSIKQELVEPLSELQGEQESGDDCEEKLSIDFDDKEIIEISDSDDDVESIDSWYSKLSQTEIIQGVDMVKKANTPREVEEKHPVDQMEFEEEKFVIPSDDRDDVTEDADNEVDDIIKRKCRVPAKDFEEEDDPYVYPLRSPEELLTEQSDSDDSDIFPPKVAKPRKNRQLRPIIDSDSDTDLETFAQETLKPPVLSPIKDAVRIAERSTPPVLSPHKKLRQSQTANRISSSDDEYDASFKVKPKTRVVQDKEVAEKRKKTIEKKLPRKPCLIDPLPMPHRKSNLRGISAETANALYQQNTEKKRLLEDLQREKEREKALNEELKSRVEAKELQEKERKMIETPVHEHETPVRIGKKRVSAVGKEGLNREKIAPVVSKTKSRKKRRDSSPEVKSKNSKYERSERLKQIALATKEKAEMEAKEHEATLSTKQKKPVSNVVMKYTATNRAAKLAEEIEKTAPQIKPVLPNHIPPSTSAPPVLPSISSLGRIPKKSVTSTITESPSGSVASNSVSTSHIVSEAIRRLSACSSKQPTPEMPLPNLQRRSSSNYTRETFPVTPLKSCIRRKKLLKMKKTVRFAEGGPSVRWFEVDENVSMNSVGKSKDSSIPKHPRDSLHQNQDYNLENIHDICRWSPLWLKEQIIKKTTPPVAGKHPPIPMLPRFTSYQDYVKVVRPLMLLNLWAAILNSYEPNNPQKQLTFAVDVVEAHPIQIPDKAMSRFHCHSLLTMEEGVHSLHPREGDLVTLELLLEADPATKKAIFIRGQQNWIVNRRQEGNSQRITLSLFAYVESFRKRRFSSHSPSKIHIELLSSVQNPSFILNMVLVLRARPYVLRIDQLMRLKRESYIKPMLRNFRALTYLEHSPLCPSILNPTEEAYYLPPVLASSFVPTNSKGKLNDLQAEAVLKVNTAFLSKEPKIITIQGPPGTGKSHMIVNLVTKLLDSLVRRQRILLCAPSNAAVDEIVLRLLNIRSQLSKEHRFNLVRLGTLPAMDPQVRSISVDDLAKKSIENQNALGPQQIESVTLQLNTLTAKKTKAHMELESARRNQKPTKQIEDKIAHFESSIAKLHRGRDDKYSRRQYEDLDQARSQILQKAHIVATTLNSCMNEIMEKAFANTSGEIFSCCIVDEASQCSEPETLLPLVHGVKVLVLVGDSMQLPAITHCKVAKENGFSESLLTRLENCFADMSINPSIMLTQQYRMHPAILRWPNEYFYKNQLRSMPGFDKYRACRVKPYVILNHTYEQENEMVFSNHREAQLICDIARSLHEDVLIPHKMTLGIITPYTRQRDHIKRMLNIEGIKVNTIDGFQGQERDIILVSCVRTSGRGFMTERQRLNVALTRAKCSLIICANFMSLIVDPMWRALADDGIVRNATTKITNKISIDRLTDIIYNKH